MSGNFLATFKSFFSKVTDKKPTSSSSSSSSSSPAAAPAAGNDSSSPSKPTTTTTTSTGSNYIVTFKKDTPDEVIDQEVEKAKASGANVTNVYKSALKGYSVTVPDDIVSSFSLQHEHVEHIEADGEVTTQGKALLA